MVYLGGKAPPFCHLYHVVCCSLVWKHLCRTLSGTLRSMRSLARKHGPPPPPLIIGTGDLCRGTFRRPIKSRPITIIIILNSRSHRIIVFRGPSHLLLCNNNNRNQHIPILGPDPSLMPCHHHHHHQQPPPLPLITMTMSGAVLDLCWTRHQRPNKSTRSHQPTECPPGRLKMIPANPCCSPRDTCRPKHPIIHSRPMMKKIIINPTLKIYTRHLRRHNPPNHHASSMHIRHPCCAAPRVIIILSKTSYPHRRRRLDSLGIGPMAMH